MGAGFAASSLAYTYVARLMLKARKVSCAEIPHAGTNAADEWIEDTVKRARYFFKRFDAFGSSFEGLYMPVTCCGTSFHRLGAAHAAVLFVEFALNLNDFSGSFAAARKQPAAHNSIG